jgi:hypothetical protein
MKKTLRKLSLSRETLRALNDGDLPNAAGGATQKNCPATGNTCDCTLGCNTVPCTTA